MVQAKGTIILDWIERMESARRTVQADLLAVKAALVASGDYKPEKLFEDWFPTPTDEDEDSGSLDVETEEGKLGVDYSAVEWKSGSEAIEEYQKLMREIGSLTTGTMSGAEFPSARGADEGWV